MLRRRDFLKLSAATACTPNLLLGAEPKKDGETCPGTYASPQEAMKAPREQLVYLTVTCVATEPKRPDYLATIDLDPKSKTYSQVIHRLAMPEAGDELHHFGWNACSSCHGDASRSRRFLVIPGFRSTRIHVADTADPRAPKFHKVLEPGEIIDKTGLTAPHTVHCLPDGNIMLSMLGDRDRNAPGGFLLLDQDFKVIGRWEEQPSAMRFNYDFWYQPRHNVMVSSEWAAPNTVDPGFNLDDVKAGKYGSRLFFWDWQGRKVAQQVELGESGMIPLEVRFHHDPQSAQGFAGAALSSTMWHWHRSGKQWAVDKVIAVEPVEVKSFPFPLPGLITDLVLSLDDRFLYFSNWLHGDLRQYDVSDPAHPKLTGQVWLGGLIGRGEKFRGRMLEGGPQMLQLSLDGKRLYVTNSLYSSWDDQFYPGIGKQGSYMLQIDCDTERGGMKPNEDFFVDFGQEPGGPSRAHEMRLAGGDCTSDIWI